MLLLVYLTVYSSSLVSRMSLRQGLACRTGFASRNDVPRSVIAGEGGQSVGRLVQVDALEGQVLTVGHHRSGRDVADDSAFHHRHHARCFLFIFGKVVEFNFKPNFFGAKKM